MFRTSHLRVDCLETMQISSGLSAPIEYGTRLVPWRKLAAPIVHVTDFGPAVMLPAGILRPNQPS